MKQVVQPPATSPQAAQFCPLLDFTNAQLVSISGSSAQSAVVNANSVILTSTTDCYYKVGSNPTASAAAGSDLLPANTKWPLTIPYGEKIAVIQVSASGSLAILPCAET